MLILGIIIGILLTFISIFFGILFSKTNVFNKVLNKVNEITRDKGYLFSEDKLEKDLEEINKD